MRGIADIKGFDFTLSELHAFVTVADHLSFRAAAELLHLSPTALSRRISQLENGLGSRLLERNTRRVQLTAAGRVFVVQAQTLLEQLEGAVTGLHDFTARQNGLITIARVPSAASYFLPSVLREFGTRYPQMLVRIMDETASNVLGSVARGEADFGINFVGAQDAGINFRSILRDPYVLAVRKDHRFAARSSVAWSELGSERYLSVTKVSGNRAHLDNALANVSRRPVAFFETARVATLIGFVEAGLGVAAVPRIALPTGPAAAVVGVPLIKPKVHRQMGLITRMDRPLRAPARELYRMIGRAAKELRPPGDG